MGNRATDRSQAWSEVLARGALDESEKIWYYPAVRIHDISERASQIKVGKDTVCIIVVW